MNPQRSHGRHRQRTTMRPLRWLAAVLAVFATTWTLFATTGSGGWARFAVGVAAVGVAGPWLARELNRDCDLGVWKRTP